MQCKYSDIGIIYTAMVGSVISFQPEFLVPAVHLSGTVYSTSSSEISSLSTSRKSP